jgi:transcriptional regulator with PAS, ATPase and Fis domain
LRERPEDIHSLVPFFVEKYARYYKHKIVAIDRRVMEFLSRCDFGGNVRELENTVRRILAYKTSGNEIVLSDIPESLWHERSFRHAEDTTIPRELVDLACRAIESGRITLPDFIAECERHVLADAIQRSNSPGEDLARRLGLSRRTLYNKRRKYHL